MKIATLVFNFVAENTYVAWDSTNECIIIDAGMSSDKEVNALVSFIEQNNLTPVMAVNTHGHFDHAMGVEALRAKYAIPFAMSSDDQYLLDGTPSGAVVYGIKMGDMPSTIDIDLSTTDQIKFGETTLKIIKTPGHTPGHVSLYNEEERVLFTGDTIFRESIGRTDLPGGDYSQLMNSIIKNIIPLGDDVKIFPGHSEDTTINHETLYNPFIVEVLNEEVKY